MRLTEEELKGETIDRLKGLKAKGGTLNNYTLGWGISPGAMGLEMTLLGLQRAYLPTDISVWTYNKPVELGSCYLQLVEHDGKERLPWSAAHPVAVSQVLTAMEKVAAMIKAQTP